MVPVYSGTDVVGVLGFTTALAIQICKFKWVPSGENRVVAQFFLGVGMPDFWTVYSLIIWVNARQGVMLKNTTSAELPPTLVECSMVCVGWKQAGHVDS